MRVELTRQLRSAVFKTAAVTNRLALPYWCARQELHLHAVLPTPDFKSGASTLSATSAHLVSAEGLEPSIPFGH